MFTGICAAAGAATSIESKNPKAANGRSKLKQPSLGYAENVIRRRTERTQALSYRETGSCTGVRAAIAGLTITSLVGCGAWLQGSTTEVPIRTRPSGAEVWIDGAYAGRTPLRASFRSSHAYLVELRAEGRATRHVRVSPEVDSALIVMDLAITAGIGLLIDLATDSLHASEPDRIDVVLREAPPEPAVEPSDGGAPTLPDEPTPPPAYGTTVSALP